MHFGVIQEKTYEGKLQNPAPSGALWVTPVLASRSQDYQWSLPTQQKKPLSLCAGIHLGTGDNTTSSKATQETEAF